MNKLTLTITHFTYDIANQQHNTTIGEFLIDDIPLCQWLGVERDLANCDTDIDSIFAIEQRFIDILKTKNLPVNQFGSPKTVLYRCHCGCDYCGVVSAEIIVNKNNVIWQNVGYETNFEINENNLDDSEKWQLTRLNFTFDKSEYFAEIDRFFDNHQNR